MKEVNLDDQFCFKTYCNFVLEKFQISLLIKNLADLKL